MAPELHGRVRTLFDEAMERPEADRLSFLQSACSGDPEVLSAVLRLLKAHRGSQSFLENGARPAHRIGRYVVTGELGRGAMGVVYEAIDPLIGRKVALKVVHLRAFADAAEAQFLRDRLFREARSAGLLSHPGIVVVFDVGQAGDLAFIAMECVEGVSLYQMLTSGRGIPRAEALAILRQTAAALDFAHRNGVVHRDIKPANIMLDRGVTVKVADFGIAKLTSTMHHTVTGMVMGTPSYMSPEQIEALPLDGRSDQFSLAVVAYELLTGRRPFHAESLATLAHMIVYADRPSARAVNPGLPPTVDAVFHRSLARLPDGRYPSCTAFVAALEEASNEIWLQAPAPALEPAPAKPAAVGGAGRMTLWVRCLVAAGIVLLASLTGFLLYKVFPPNPRQVVGRRAEKSAVPPGAKITVRPKSSAAAPRKVGRSVEATRSLPPVKGTADDAANLPLTLPHPSESKHVPEKLTPPVDTAQIHMMVNGKDGQRYIWIPPGNFTMGCSGGDTECGANEKPTYTYPVRVSYGFWLGQTEVTQAAYRRVTGDNPSTQRGDQLPVESVTWNEAENYCLALGGHLPMEIEWEYAARAGTNGARYGSLDAIAWYLGNSSNTNQPVAGKLPNAFGLYDMLGNMWEWMEDSYEGTESKIVRGGARIANARAARVSHRIGVEPWRRNDDKGFRCAGDWPAPDAEPERTTAPPSPLPAGAGTPGPDGVYRAGNGVSQPKLLRKVEPYYDETDRQAKIRGVVVLDIVVDANGNVASTKVIKSLVWGLDEKAAEAVRQWKFEPARKNGKPVPVAATVELNFHLL